MQKEKARLEVARGLNDSSLSHSMMGYTPMSEINVDAILEEYEERYNNPHRSDSPKRFHLSAAVKKDIKNALMVGQNGKIHFKNKRANGDGKKAHLEGSLKATKE